MTNAEITYLSAGDVELVLAGLDVVGSAAEVLALSAEGLVRTPAKAYLSWAAADGTARTLNMPSWVGSPEGMLVGTKIINGNPRNTRLGIPRAAGLILLFDPETGHIRTIMQAARISALRTAAVTAVATEHLCAESPRVLALIGSGTLAEAHVEVLLARLPDLEQVLIYDQDERRTAELLARQAGAGHRRDVRLDSAALAETAVSAADVTVTVTTVTEGYLRYEWLKPGAVLVNVSLDDPTPEVFLQADALVVDDWGLITADRNRILGKLHRSGRVSAPGTVGAPERGEGRTVDAHLGEVVTGRKSVRTSSKDIILVNPIGMSAQDVVLAHKVEAKAAVEGVGLAISG